MTQNRGGDHRIVDGEDEASFAGMLESARDAEDGGMVVVRTFVNRFDRCGCSAVSLYRDDRFEDLGCHTRDAFEEQFLFRTSHPARAAAHEDVAVHRR